MGHERRHFNRVMFDSDAVLNIDSVHIPCRIIDVSLHGVLLSLPNHIEIDLGAICDVHIPLDESEHRIQMQAQLSNHRGTLLGLECKHIDLDSITHLRRLIELNLGDIELLERDFTALVASHF